VLGIGGGYLTSRAEWNDIGGSTGNVSTGVLGAYGGTRFGPMLIDGAVAGTYSSIDVNRQIVIPNGLPDGLGLSTAISRTANGTTQSPGIAARLDFGTNLQGTRAALKPFVGLSYSWLDRRAFTESGAGSIDLTVNDQISDGLRSRLGAVGCYELMVAGPFVWASMPPDPFIASEAAAGVYLEERNRRMLEDNRRQIAEAEERMRAHEEREAAEARKAQEANRAAYYAEHGWPT
jgi:hypothetical protein